MTSFLSDGNLIISLSGYSSVGFEMRDMRVISVISGSNDTRGSTDDRKQNSSISTNVTFPEPDHSSTTQSPYMEIYPPTTSSGGSITQFIKYWRPTFYILSIWSYCIVLEVCLHLSKIFSKC